MTTTRSAAGLASVAVALVLGLVACGDDGDTASTGTPPDTTSTTTSTTTTTTTASTTVPPTTTPTTATTAVAGPPVTVLDAFPGGGSGEIELTWDGVPGATGYRVERADAPGGPFEAAATVDLVTGEVTMAEGVVNMIPAGGSLPFTYVEVGAGQRYLRVVARHPGGDAEPSAVVCGAPPGQPDC